MSRDHKPELEAERERILKAGGFIHGGRVNGSLNLARAIGAFHFCRTNLRSLFIYMSNYLLCSRRHGIQAEQVLTC